MRETFEQLGGEFAADLPTLQSKFQPIKALLFDWDGVFNDGKKGEGIGSSFSEADSMGTNLLRFALWQQHQEQQPYIGIITGAQNPTALEFAKREHFHAVYFRILDKTTALADFCDKFSIESHQVAYCFDDVNDLGVAEKVGFRTLIRRKASPLFANFMRQNQLFEYHTAQEGGSHAIREFCELSLGLLGKTEQVIQSRRYFDAFYQQYFEQRQALETKFYTQENNLLTEWA